MKFEFVPSVRTCENKKHYVINAFQRGSNVYCAKCSKRGKWKHVDSLVGFLENDKSMYGIKCHNEELKVKAEHFNDTMRINGPVDRSFIAFIEQ